MTALFVSQDSKAWSLYVPTAINYQSSGKSEYPPKSSHKPSISASLTNKQFP
jgi:hypothetical protein